MWKVIACGVTATAVLAASDVTAQTPDAAQTAVKKREEMKLALKVKESRYQMSQMERVLEGAVEHGATLIRDRLRNVMPADMLLTENARARGFRLDGYGVFFDVEVPALEGALPWSFRTLDQNNLGVDNAMQTLRAFVQGAAADDVNLQQALKRIELQVSSSGSLLSPNDNSLLAAPAAAVADANGAATDAPTPAASGPPDVVLENMAEAYRAEIREALINAMLEHSRGLAIQPNEWLTIAARRSDDRPRLAPADPEGQTVIISLRGADLMDFLKGQVSHEEARKRIDLRVF
jgi:hypothetical protein